MKQLSIRNGLGLAFSLLGLFFAGQSAKAQVLEMDSLALIEILDKNCNGCPLENSQAAQFWETDSLVGTWPGVSIQGNRVVRLELDSLGLSGTLASLSGLEYLTCLNLLDNDLTALESLLLPNLDSLIFSNNRLTEFPLVLGLPTLSYLMADSNQLESLPDSASLGSILTFNCQGNEIPVIDLEEFHWVTNFTFEQNYFPTPGNETYLWIEDAYDSCAAIPNPQLAKFLSGTQTILTITFSGIPPVAQLSPSFCFSAIFSFQTNLSPALLPVDQSSIVIAPASPQIITDSLQIHNYRVANSLLGSNSSIKIDRRLSSISCKCGDTNIDGIWSMHDLFPIALLWHESGQQRNYTLTQNDTTPQPALLWGDSVFVAPQFINGCYVDSDGSGFIDQDDMKCITENYSALELSNYLQTSVQDTISLSATPQDQLISALPNGDISIPFRIELDQLPFSIDSVFLRGAIFVRGVAQSSSYSIDSIYGDFTNSDFIRPGPDLVAMQMYLDTIVLDSSQQSCLDYESNQLDVGVFRGDTAVWIQAGDALLECIVVIHPQPDQTGQLDSIIPVLGDVNSVVLYMDDGNGNYFQVLAECKADTTILLTDSLLDRSSIAGDIFSPTNLPVPDVSVTGTNLGLNTFTTACDTTGDYFLTVPFADTVDVTLEKAKDASILGEITVADLFILEKFLQSGKGLDAYQCIAADVDGNGLIELNDYLTLRNYIDKVAQGFPVQKFWVFVNDDAPIIKNGNAISYQDSRSYGPAYRSYGQDYTAVLLGDLNQSWGGGGASNKKAQVQEFSATVVQAPYPNPFSDSFTLEFFREMPATIHWQVMNLTGGTIHTDRYSHPGGTGKIHWDANAHPGISTGLYLVQLQIEEETYIFKIFLQ